MFHVKHSSHFRATPVDVAFIPACDVFHVKHFATFEYEGVLSGLAMWASVSRGTFVLDTSHNEIIVMMYHLYATKIRNSLGHAPEQSLFLGG